ncbi:MAG: isopentenyl-diphosphate Delta-isomerase [Myxococcota bacterium]
MTPVFPAAASASVAPPESPSRRSLAPLAAATAERVVLVDERDRPIGTAEKLAAHRDGGLLHRAFSIFLFDREGRMLLQQRAAAKYHFPSLWTNACCSHPRPGETVEAAAHRRLFEELGVEAVLVPLFSFVYRAEDRVSGLVEREFDHVFAGRIESEPRLCPDEVSAVAYEAFEVVERRCLARPDDFTPWFQLALRELRARGFVERWATPVAPAAPRD